ncbi:helix-turn-helix domain-containing protein [Streptomyces luteireticuli]|uniref:AraC family transcriptional regulator n=1 Tax=Streptomyces luteireticuli TaxID=173858 RepID=UPI0035577FDB
MVEVLLTPLMAYTLLGRHLSEIAGSAVGLSALLRPGERERLEGVLEAGSWPARFALVDRMIIDRYGRGVPPAPEVTAAWNRLAGTGGQVPIARLARDVGWSQRRLERRFGQQTGLTPKKAARILRLLRAVRMLADGSSPAATASACGYYDQAHFTHDCQLLIGCAPRQLRFPPLGAGVAFLQDSASRAVADSGAADTRWRSL